VKCIVVHLFEQEQVSACVLYGLLAVGLRYDLLQGIKKPLMGVNNSCISDSYNFVLIVCHRLASIRL